VILPNGASPNRSNSFCRKVALTKHMDREYQYALIATQYSNGVREIDSSVNAVAAAHVLSSTHTFQSNPAGLPNNNWAPELCYSGEHNGSVSSHENTQGQYSPMGNFIPIEPSMNNEVSQPMVQLPVHPTWQPHGSQVQGQWYDHTPQVPQSYYQPRLPSSYDVTSNELDGWYLKPDDQKWYATTSLSSRA
jgi:hypothetical protein